MKNKYIWKNISTHFALNKYIHTITNIYIYNNKYIYIYMWEYICAFLLLHTQETRFLLQKHSWKRALLFSLSQNSSNVAASKSRSVHPLCASPKGLLRTPPLVNSLPHPAFKMSLLDAKSKSSSWQSTLKALSSSNLEMYTLSMTGSSAAVFTASGSKSKMSPNTHESSGT